jgi:transposase InsO family protein
MHAGELAEMQLLENIASRLRAAAHGMRGAIADEGARLLGVTVPTLYTRLRKVGWSSGKKLRADKGDSRVPVDEAKQVAAILQASRRTTGKQLLPVCDAIDVALSNGILSERVSSQTMLRIMRREGCHPDQLSRATPHTSMRSLHPNHVWQLDASICVLYYLKNGRAAVLDERTFNARKPKDMARVSNLRVMRFALTDHTSGTVIARYYNAAGEDQRTVFDFLMWSMHKQGDRVMHGVPWMLVWDAGSANQSHGIRNLLTALGVRHWAHTPGNPRAKGQIESVHNVIERKFEGRLTFTHIDSIEQLNAHLDTWLRSFNGVEIHSRHKHARDAVWQTIRADQLRLCPPVDTCAVLMHSKPEPRTVVGNLTISYKPRGFESAAYSVAHVPGVRVGDRLQVVLNPYRAPAIYIVGEDSEGSTRYYECDPIATDAAGFFSDAPVFGERFAAQADTQTDIARKDANEAAYGERDTLDATSAKVKGAVAFEGRIDPFADVREKAAQTPTFMQRRGTEIDLPNRAHVELKPLDLVEALFELRSRLGRALGQAEREAVQAWFPDGVQPEQLDGLVERIQQLSAAGAPPAFNEAPRLVAVK